VKKIRCPLCKRGVVREWTMGTCCSRRYSHGCDFGTGICDSPAEWKEQVARELARAAAEKRARKKVCPTCKKRL
jgi:hypothetical protein